MTDAPKSIFVRVGDICGGQVTATTYPFPEGLEYKLVQPEAGVVMPTKTLNNARVLLAEGLFYSADRREDVRDTIREIDALLCGPQSGSPSEKTNG